MTEQGAAADNADRDGAPGGAGPFAGARASSQDAQAGRSQGWPKGADRKAPGRLPALHSPHFEGNKENRDDGPARGPKSNHGTAKRWLNGIAASTGPDLSRSSAALLSRGKIKM